MTETIRSSFMKKVKLMQWSDKVHHSAARGTSFCSANGMNIIALALTFGRCSELNCVKACARWLKLLPSRVHIAYDKGIRGMRSLLPNLNFFLTLITTQVLLALRREAATIQADHHVGSRSGSHRECREQPG